MRKKKKTGSFLKIFICILIVGIACLGYCYFQKITNAPQKTDGTEDNTLQTDEQNEDFTEDFILSLNMSRDRAEEIILETCGGIPGESYTDVNTEHSAFMVDSLGALGEQSAKIFLEFDRDGLYCIELFFMDGNKAGIPYLHKVFGDSFAEITNSMGETYNVFCRQDGLVVLYDYASRVIIYDAFRQNVWTEGRNSEYKIRLNDLTNAN